MQVDEFDALDKWVAEQVAAAEAATPLAPVWPLKALPLADAFNANTYPTRLLRMLLGLTIDEAAAACRMTASELLEIEALTLDDAQSLRKLETIAGRLALVLAGYTGQGASHQVYPLGRCNLRNKALEFPDDVAFGVHESNRLERWMAKNAPHLSANTAAVAA